MSSPAVTSAASEFRFYEELNDFLPRAVRKQAFSYRFRGTPAVKDAIDVDRRPCSTPIGAAAR